MRKQRFVTLCLLVSTASVGLIEAQLVDNVDTRDPIAFLSPDSGASDLFGFALALHQIEEVRQEDDLMTAVSKTRIIVGAPKGTFPGGLNLSDPGNDHISHTGLIYACSIAPGSMGCDAIQRNVIPDDDTDSLKGTGRLFDQTPNANVVTGSNFMVVVEDKENQLLGATVYSNGDTIVICAPYWTTTGIYDSSFKSTAENMVNKINRLSRGRCYWVNRNLTDVAFLDPCNSQSETYSQVRDEGQPYCTAGTGVTVVSTSSESRVFVIGVPGYDQGKGALFWGGVNTEASPLFISSLVVQEKLEDRNNTPSYGRGNLLHPNSSGVPEQLIDVDQGFQVASGFITQSRAVATHVPNVLTSVPRYDNTDYRGRIDIYNVSNIQNLLDVTAEGQQFGEYFGYSLATADINNDGYDEVLVGAPMYTDFNNVNVEIGRTYIFKNTGGDLSSEPIIFEGSVSKGRFGVSAVNLGDIDQDGYEDVAIGAPYEVNGDSTGVVYIYYGSSNFTTFQQQTPFKIRAQDIKNELSSVTELSKLETFGFSLSSGVDVDNNGYNDLAIGAFESGSIFVLRTLPVANVVVVVTSLESEVVRVDKKCNVTGVLYACFNVTVRVTYSGTGLSGPLDVSILLSEVRSNNEQRIFFDRNPSMNTLSLTMQPSPNAVGTVTIYIVNDIIDTSNNLTFMATVQQNPLRTFTSSNGQPPIRDLVPDFRIRISESTSTEVRLLNNCGSNDVCETDSSLAVETPPTYLPSGRDYTSIEVGGVKQVQFRVNLTNTGTNESAIVLMLTVEHSRTGVFSDQLTVVYVDSGDSVTCVSPCNVRELKPSDHMVIEVTLSVLSQITVGVVNTTFNLTSTQTVDDNVDNNAQIISLRVEKRADLTVSLSFPQEAVYTNMKPPEGDRSDVGPRIALEVIASNVGSTTINNARLYIYYPAQSSATGSDLFFLLPDCSVDTSVIPTTAMTSITCDSSALKSASSLSCPNGNSRGKRHTISPAVRKHRREASSHPRVTRQEAKALDTATNLNCRENPQECLLITCDIAGLQGQGLTRARVTVGGYMDQRFFADKSDDYLLTTYAVVSFNETSEATIDDKDTPDAGEALLKLVSSGGGGGSEGLSLIEIAVIVVVVLVGIVLVIIVAIILYCCGFFRRKKTHNIQEEETTRVALTTEEEKSPPLQDMNTL